MRSIPREVPSKVEGPRRDYTPAPQQSVIEAYLQGALHDGTYNLKHKSFRITQSNQQWLSLLQRLLKQLSYRSWIYREGKQRTVYVIETTASFLDLAFDPTSLQTREERIAYVRGYFDAEGGFPRNQDHWLYIQFSQKNAVELVKVRQILEELGIRCGKVHVPSMAKDKDYYRFFISRQSHRDFMQLIGSWHPRKSILIAQRMKI